MISLREVSKEYELGEVRVNALKNLTLDIDRGKFVVLLGPSGSGKTTLLNLVSALDIPTSGKILIDGNDISFYTRKQRAVFRRLTIGFIFQFFNLLPTLTALENIEFSLDLVGVEGDMGSRSFDKHVIRGQALYWLKEVGLDNRASHFPSQLSGGEQQRVAIARALAKNPPIVVADEPTGNLDYRNGVKILRLMKRLNETTQKTFLIATHNQQIAKIADVIIGMQTRSYNMIIQKQPTDLDNIIW
ncbi:MAG: ABC transporter ATP-binding protein [Candidatus Thorarchaeota archaeon]